MKVEQFWAHVDATRAAPDIDEQVRRLHGLLTGLTMQEPLSFDDHYTRASHALYTWEIHAAARAMLGFVSDDVFADFRSWMISRGHSAYDAVRADPDTGLAHLGSRDFNEIGASEAFGGVVG